jgi:acetyl-CoA carboxylase biotin carboxyl carrier protein
LLVGILIVGENWMSSNSGSTPGDVFDVRKVRKFIELMNEHDLSEIDLRQADQRIRLRRGPEFVNMAGTTPMMSAPTGGAGTPAASALASSGGSSGSGENANQIAIRSPMVGTFYAAASPDSAPFVKVGDQVGPETTVCIIEAMKVFNEIPAECSGKIVAVLATSGQATEFGQALFRVEPNA